MKDNFSRQADLYAKYRPRYPRELFDFILAQTSLKQKAWDCATGNGQTANILAHYFEKVSATDISKKQIEQAGTTDNVTYSVQPAEKTNFPGNSFDLITVSQALHWFATDEFYKEVSRVAKNGCVFAAWCYSLLHINPEIDEIIKRFYTDVVGPYWDAERKLVDDEYRSIPFPFTEIESPKFEMKYDWTIDELEGYINTWSATQKYITATGNNPTVDLIKEIKSRWSGQIMKVVFPLHLRVGIIDK